MQEDVVEGLTVNFVVLFTVSTLGEVELAIQVFWLGLFLDNKNNPNRIFFIFLSSFWQEGIKNKIPNKIKIK